MLILECSQGCYGMTDGQKEGRKDERMDGSVTVSLRNFAGEGIINCQKILSRNQWAQQIYIAIPNPF